MLGAQFGMTDAVSIAVDKDQYLAALTSRWQAHNFRIAAFLEAAVLAYGDVSGQVDRKWWVEKTPGTERYGRLLARWYPGMKMVYIVRDPRANYSALKRWREKMSQRLTLPRFAHGWESSLSYNWKNQRLVDVLTLRYEDLVTDTVGSMVRVCQFLDIAYHECLLSPTLAGESFSGNSIYGTAFSGVSSSSLYRWRDVLSFAEVAQIQALLCRYLTAYGYGLESPVNGDRTGSKDMVLAYLSKKMYDFYDKLPELIKDIRRK
jgi:hypothetical protein